MRFWFVLLCVIGAGCIAPPPSTEVLNPDMDSEDVPVGTDMDSTPDMDNPNVCNPEGDAAACQRLNIECGSMTFVDQCSGERSIECGTCEDHETCLETGVCDSGESDDARFCAENGFCGSVERNSRLVDCGNNCEAPETCGAVTPNRCGCQGEAAGVLCAAAGNPCGTVELTDSCGKPLVVTCSTCVEPQSCGGGGEPGVCGCTPQSDAQVCASLNKNCGNLVTTDNCGAERPVNCGECASPQVCSVDGVPNVCGGMGCTPSSDVQFCQDLGKNCGSVTGTDNCGMTRTEMCGDCTSPETCGGNNFPNVCGCLPESNAVFCGRYQTECGMLSGIDNCGGYREVVCGTCENGARCSDGTCGLTPGLCGALICVPPEVCQPTIPPHCCQPGDICK